jgi:glutathione synthase/RimK-type ligase-like ATP-grasp enzyme
MIAIHKRLGSFSDRWIKYCDENKIRYKIVNCYDTKIIAQLKDCNGLMWHWSHMDYQAQNFARQLIFSVEKIGIKVFPSFETCWHFDDKVGQKYLFESISAPLVPSYAFYNKKTALAWIENITFPKVFKLRGGAGSLNVKLVKNKKEAKRLVYRAFNEGFYLVDSFSIFKNRLWILHRDKNLKATVHLLKGLIRLIWHKKDTNLLPVQKGYIYFQDFIANNKYDDRIVIIGNRAFALRRFVRENDFRASGSGIIEYIKENFNIQALEIAFEIANKIDAQSIAFDFVYEKGNPLIVEISYAYSMGDVYDNCHGYWDSELNWHDRPVNPQYFIIKDFMNLIGE